VARSSLMELGTHLTVASNMDLLPAPECAKVTEQMQDTGKMLGRLIAILKSQTKAGGRGVPCPVSHLPCPLNQTSNNVSRVPNA